MDSPLDFIVGKRVLSCTCAGNGNSIIRCPKPGVAKHCPSTCGKCDEFIIADSDQKFVLEENGTKKKCGFFVSIILTVVSFMLFHLRHAERLVPTVIKRRLKRTFYVGTISIMFWKSLSI